MKRTTIKAILAVCISILATGAAGAADCPLVATKGPDAFESDLKRPDLLGQEFRVSRVSYQHEPAGPGHLSREFPTNVVTWELRAGQETFVLTHAMSGGSFDFIGSYDPSELLPHQTRFGYVDARAVYSPAASPEGVVFRGPLEHMVLKPRC